MPTYGPGEHSSAKAGLPPGELRQIGRKGDAAPRVTDAVETNRDALSGLLDIYLSTMSNRMNAVMKVLTIIATIFIPLSFFAGV